MVCSMQGSGGNKVGSPCSESSTEIRLVSPSKRQFIDLCMLSD